MVVVTADLLLDVLLRASTCYQCLMFNVQLGRLSYKIRSPAESRYRVIDIQELYQERLFTSQDALRGYIGFRGFGLIANQKQMSRRTYLRVVASGAVQNISGASQIYLRGRTSATALIAQSLTLKRARCTLLVVGRRDR